jgi:hypothetical protein
LGSQTTYQNNVLLAMVKKGKNELELCLRCIRPECGKFFTLKRYNDHKSHSCVGHANEEGWEDFKASFEQLKNCNY